MNGILYTYTSACIYTSEPRFTEVRRQVTLFFSKVSMFFFKSELRDEVKEKPKLIKSNPLVKEFGETMMQSQFAYRTDVCPKDTQTIKYPKITESNRSMEQNKIYMHTNLHLRFNAKQSQSKELFNPWREGIIIKAFYYKLLKFETELFTNTYIAIKMLRNSLEIN